MPKAVINGVKLHYLQIGDPDASDCDDLVMLHGLASNLAFWYFQYAQELANRFRVTLLDFRGHGRSDMPPSGYSPEELSRDVGGLLDYLGVERAHFIAHSFGGLVALHYARRHPSKVRSMVLADCYVPGLCSSRPAQAWAQGLKLRPILQRHGIDLDTEDPRFGFRLLGVMARLRLSGKALPPDLLGLFGPVMQRFGQNTAEQWLKLLEATTAEADITSSRPMQFEELRGLGFPICAMYGDGSHARRVGDELLGAWPEAEFRLVRHAGHFFPVSRADELLSQCKQFWDSCGNGGVHVRRPNDTRAYFQSDRFYMVDGAWCCLLREGVRLGPFPSREEAARQLTATLAALRAP